MRSFPAKIIKPAPVGNGYHAVPQSQINAQIKRNDTRSFPTKIIKPVPVGNGYHAVPQSRINLQTQRNDTRSFPTKIIKPVPVEKRLSCRSAKTGKKSTACAKIKKRLFRRFLYFFFCPQSKPTIKGQKEPKTINIFSFTRPPAACICRRRNI